MAIVSPVWLCSGCGKGKMSSGLKFHCKSYETAKEEFCDGVSWDLGATITWLCDCGAKSTFTKKQVQAMEFKMVPQDHWSEKDFALEGIKLPIAQSARGQKIGRNDPCLCGSGKKYKKCCGA